jgi:hypothetical protein
MKQDTHTPAAAPEWYAVTNQDGEINGMFPMEYLALAAAREWGPCWSVRPIMNPNAAPDLLAALRHIERHLDNATDDGVFGYYEEIDCLKRARAALARAEGGKS